MFNFVRSIEPCFFQHGQDVSAKVIRSLFEIFHHSALNTREKAEGRTKIQDVEPASGMQDAAHFPKGAYLIFAGEMMYHKATTSTS